MTEEEKTVLLIKGTIADMSKDHQAEVMECYAIMKQLLHDRPLAGLAIALLGAELSV